MLHRDHLMRLVEQLVQALAKIDILKEQQNYSQALDVIRETGKLLVGVDLSMLNFISDSDLLTLFKAGDPLNAGRFIVLAGLLYEEGDINLILEKNNESFRCYLKSLVLYCEAIKFKEILNQQDYFDKIETIVQKLSGYDLTWNAKSSLIIYYEATGKYSGAEDLIFELAEAGDEQILSSGISFYQRLLLKTDEEIEKGNLTREEIENAILELNKMAHR